MTEPERALDELERRLRRHPPERYPLQHATDRFHQACVLVELGRAEEARVSAAAAVELFAPLPGERAKASNVLGVALRLARRWDEAAVAFRAAEVGFELARLPLEHAAAAHNLGLVAADAGDRDAAIDAFARARDRFAQHGALPQQAASARELGQALLVAGRPREAIPVLSDAVELADRVGDRAGYGAASNALGLALLAEDDADAAVETLRAAVSVHPRSIRPDGYAMAKANLALALERVGDQPRARLAARQARDVPGAHPVVRAQADETLARLGSGDARDLLAVLDGERPTAWPAIVREEVLRWLDVGGTDPHEWVTGILARPASETDLLEAWLHVALELAPDAMRQFVEGLAGAAAALEEGERNRLRTAVSAAALRFAGPQWDRLRAELGDAVARTGLDPAGWR